MKKIIFLSVFMSVAALSDAQVLISLLFGDKLNSPKIEFGLAGGLNMATIKNQENAKYNSLFNLGFYFDFKFKNPAWMIHTGVLVKSEAGAAGIPLYSLNNPDLDSAFKGGSVTRKISYFNVPIFMKYQFKNRFFVFAGPQLALRKNARDIFKNSVEDEDDLTYEVNIKKQIVPIDAGLAAGIGYHLKGTMSLFIHYYQGLTNIQESSAVGKQYNNIIYFSACIPVGGIKQPPKK